MVQNVASRKVFLPVRHVGATEAFRHVWVGEGSDTLEALEENARKFVNSSRRSSSLVGRGWSMEQVIE